RRRARAGGSGRAAGQPGRASRLPGGLLPPVARPHAVSTVAQEALQGKMKPRLQTSLGQQLVLTPQLRQALHLLQLSALELEAEINSAVESNPLLDWDESVPQPAVDGGDGTPAGDGEAGTAELRDDDWGQAGEAWRETRGWNGEDD